MIKKLERLYVEEKDLFIHFNKDMLKNNILIEERTLIDGNVETTINVKYFNDIDAVHHTIYEGDLLTPIQIYRIIKDIYELFTENSLKDFLDVMDTLSISTMSASMQTEEKNKEDIMNWVKESFGDITYEQIESEGINVTPFPTDIEIFGDVGEEIGVSEGENKNLNISKILERLKKEGKDIKILKDDIDFNEQFQLQNADLIRKATQLPNFLK